MEDQQRRAQREFSVSLFHPFTVSLFPCCSFFIFHFSISLLLFFTVFLFLLNGPQFLFHCFHVSHFHFAVSLFFCFSVSLANCFSFHWFSVSLFRCFSLIYCLTVCLFLWSNVALFHWFSVSLFLFHWFTVSGCISENRGWWIPVRQLRQIDGNATGRQETGLPYHDKITKTRKQQTKNISALTFLYFAKGRIVILRRRTQFINFNNGFELSGVKNDWGLYSILLTLLQNLAIRKAWPIYHNAKLNVASIETKMHCWPWNQGLTLFHIFMIGWAKQIWWKPCKHINPCSALRSVRCLFVVVWRDLRMIMP